MAEDDRKRYFKEMETWRIQHILGNFIKSFNSVGGLTLVLNRRGEIVTLNQTEVITITKIIASNSIFFMFL